MRIVVYKNDGKGAIKAPVMIWEEHEGETAEEIVSKIDPSLEPVIMERKDLPSCQEFFFAWKLDSGNINIDLEIAKDITKNRLRMQRTPLLVNLDVQFQRALETNADTKSIVNEKQRLRDLPLLVDSCNSVEELQNLSVNT
jgi:hypothetical protein